MNNLTNEPSTKTKTDVLDLIISFLMEHEKQMDQMLQRLEGLVETLSKRGDDVERTPTPKHRTGLQPNSFKLTVNNPGSLAEMRSLKIEWGPKTGTIPNAITDVDAIVGKIERSVGKD